MRPGCHPEALGSTGIVPQTHRGTHPGVSPYSCQHSRAPCPSRELGMWLPAPRPRPSPDWGSLTRDLPLLELWGRDEPRRLGAGALHAALPPVAVILVDDLNHVAGLELQPRFLAGDQAVFFGVIVKLRPHEHLEERKGCSWHGRAGWLSLAISSSQPHTALPGSSCAAAEGLRAQAGQTVLSLFPIKTISPQHVLQQRCCDLPEARGQRDTTTGPLLPGKQSTDRGCAMRPLAKEEDKHGTAFQDPATCSGPTLKAPCSARKVGTDTSTQGTRSGHCLEPSSPSQA